MTYHNMLRHILALNVCGHSGSRHLEEWEGSTHGKKTLTTPLTSSRVPRPDPCWRWLSGWESCEMQMDMACSSPLWSHGTWPRCGIGSEDTEMLRKLLSCMTIIKGVTTKLVLPGVFIQLHNSVTLISIGSPCGF